MDPNLQTWNSPDQSFLSRLQMWLKLLDPTLLLRSEAEIQTAHSLLAEKSQKDEASLTLALSSVHAGSGAVLPLVFRPPAFLPIAGPLAVASFLPHSSVKPALFWQVKKLVHHIQVKIKTVTKTSTIKNPSVSFCCTVTAPASTTPTEVLQSRQETPKVTSTDTPLLSHLNVRMPLKQLLLIVGTVSYATCAGALPQIFISRLGIRSPPVQTLFRSVVPAPLSAALAFFNVSTVRSEESETGVRVFDSSGNPVGVSKAAGQKAVREAALSRAAMFGTTGAVPTLLVFLLKRTRLFQTRPLLVAPLRHISVGLVLGLMIPVSFSLFPQLGTIKKGDLEEELQAAAVDGQLFYHRGL
ncbi:sideroflexin-4 isoform X1 [Echeneis naucrates]|uniref:sideroflexin-4 isoform X1 n=1 Tax=Echeneis naucrates TaxID=173247 RepID=UPI001113DAA0|nr:sideroflexin-4 isoform X1 [Echeneis naucrates]